ncbi:DUF1298 domain-containing protein [Rhodococcus sp. BP-149]|uniref:wax ester/triacylglycerol synthase domain-containing protein n=1 Tax=unclassified Rhodococcus (in: high G+C Gram-positive bacteria) TaxID=192944 RepID=UPI001C9AB5FD|nr:MULTISPECIES: wax ester/triacylglycerol synthase domain-containing protein [unclassified Rhodococcus (in: high G+C Gram-positive bacteria)]MBY6685112.1 DUF1298 domain-containing protein [Rhodococcus sp. BP-288]MBY6692404.1 DUF1298 domain-containing protein [Rhodococcus sp. BP-188]MBY6698302.1 DUF1298 domain-containing protein [Rhodococcus sp. BP-285]MBY6700981.1 DUF1298 domain-containing protein [Rhodococcus sp. BP-283]MBY6711982.1 DUF1298 domain-containing protein [Rhodococcus sp. BP-160]
MATRRHTSAVGEPMAPRDALNYYFESERTPGTIVHGIVVDAARSDGSLRTLADVERFARSVLDLHPLFRRRLRTTIADLAFPVWVECDVDVRAHVFVHDASAADEHPDHFLRRRVMDASSTPFDFDVPAWQIHLVTGLRGVPGVPEGGSVLLLKVHHSAIDGMGTTSLVHRMLAPPSADVSAHRNDVFDRESIAVPTPFAALRSLPREFAGFAGRGVRRWRAVRQLDPVQRPTAHHYPATRFNRNLAPDMTFGMAWFDLDRVRAIKSAVPGATVNDVVMTVVSIALSDYLGGELPATSLGASFPVNVRTVDTTGETANQLAIAVVDLFTDVADPVDRLRAVSAAARDRKSDLATRLRSLPSHPMNSAPAPLLAAIARLMPRRPAAPTTTGTNTLISNIAYGNDRMELAGAPVTGVFAPLPVVEGVQLAHVVVSAGDRMCLTAVSHRALMPDVDHYTALLASAVDTLAVATDTSERASVATVA